MVSFKKSTPNKCTLAEIKWLGCCFIALSGLSLIWWTKAAVHKRVYQESVPSNRRAES